MLFYMKKTLLALVLFCLALPSSAMTHSADTAQKQRHFRFTDARVYLGFDKHNSLGFERNMLYNAAVLTSFSVGHYFQFTPGFQYSSFGLGGRYSFALTNRVLLHQGAKTRWTLANRYLYRAYPDYDLSEFTSGLAVELATAHWEVSVGLCNRSIMEDMWNVNTDPLSILEPMGLTYYIHYNLRPRESRWNLGLGLSNMDLFIMERETQLRFSLHGFYSVSPHLSLTTYGGFHPTGTISLTAVNDGFYINLGANYKF